MPRIWVKEALAVKRTRFKLEDVSLNWPVSELKNRLKKSSGIEKICDIIYRGLLLKENCSLESYGVKEDSTVYVIYRESQDPGIQFEVNVKDLRPVLLAATASPVFKEKMTTLIKNPGTLEMILTLAPSLAKDPVALTILKDPEILQNLVQTGDIIKLAEEHPSLIQAASHIAANITKDISGSSRIRGISNSEDDDLMDIEPEMFAQAEMMAAQEEAIQNQENAHTSSNPRPITSSFLASALQVARANLVSTSTQTASVHSTSTSTNTSQIASSVPQAAQPHISSEFFSQAMASALTANNVQRNSFESEIQQLRDLGIEDEALSLRALTATNGDVEAACNLIFEGGLQ